MIAVAQTIPKRGDIETNVQEHIQLIKAAAKAGVQLLVFPELSLTGYELDMGRKLALSEDDTQLAPLIELAAQYGVTAIVGAPVRSGQHFHIGAFILSPDRSVALYTKHHLGAFPPEVSPSGRVPPAEGTVFAPGDRSPLIDMGNCIAAPAYAPIPARRLTRSKRQRGAPGFIWRVCSLRLGSWSRRAPNCEAMPFGTPCWWAVPISEGHRAGWRQPDRARSGPTAASCWPSCLRRAQGWPSRWLQSAAGEAPRWY